MENLQLFDFTLDEGDLEAIFPKKLLSPFGDSNQSFYPDKLRTAALENYPDKLRTASMPNVLNSGVFL
jgi:hypothetical protein